MTHMDVLLKLVRRFASILAVAVLLMVGSVATCADEAADARGVASSFFKYTDKEDAEGAYTLAGEQLKRIAPKEETLAGLRRWFQVKGGPASSRELVLQRTITPEEAHAQNPQLSPRGNIYGLRYKSNYPNGAFFEDLYISKDSDDVLRIQAHQPQPAQ